MFGSFLPNLGLDKPKSTGSKEPTLLCNQVGSSTHMSGYPTTRPLTISLCSHFLTHTLCRLKHKEKGFLTRTSNLLGKLVTLPALTFGGELAKKN